MTRQVGNGLKSDSKTVTWEDLLGDFVGLADQFLCATCMNRIFRGSTGHWGQKVTLNKVAPAGALKDENGKAITFQCQDCVGKEPIMLPQVHPNGQVVNHIKIAELADHEPEGKEQRDFGDYDDRAEQLAISQKQGLPDDTAERISESIEQTQNEETIVNENQDGEHQPYEDIENKTDRQPESDRTDKNESSHTDGSPIQTEVEIKEE